MKIKNKRKFMISTSILGLIILFITVLSTQSFSKVEYTNKTVYVAKGETLWSIACEEQENNLYYEGRDVRDILNSIKFTNNLKDSYIYEGQKLEIPTL